MQMMTFRPGKRWNTSLPARLSEMAILITARQWSAQYEWFAHYPIALKEGVSAAVLAAAAFELLPPLVIRAVVDAHLVVGRAEGLLWLAVLYLGASAP